MQEHTTHSVLIVEDDPECLNHFASAIRACDALRLAGAVNTRKQGLALIDAAPPDVLLTDFKLPDGYGIELIQHARRVAPHTQILVISVFADENTVINCVRAGASGYLLKDGSAHEIAAKVMELVNGGSPLSASVARYVLRSIQTVSEPPAHAAAKQRYESRAVPNLTEREIGVLELLAKGFSPPEIAEILGISRHTVITHSRSIHRKLEVSSRSEAIYEALNLGLIRLRD